MKRTFEKKEKNDMTHRSYKIIKLALLMLDMRFQVEKN